MLKRDMSDLNTKADTLDETYSKFTKISGMQGYSTISQFTIEDT